MDNIACPYHLTKNELEDILSKMTIGSTFCYNNTLYIKDSNGINKINRGNPNRYISIIDADNTLNNSLTLIKKNNHLRIFHNKEIITILPGSDINFNSFETSSDNCSLFAISNKTSNLYFDLVIYFISCSLNDETNSQILGQINYNKSNKIFKRVVHSGDIGSLLHKVHGIETLKENEYAVVCAIGYNKEPLINFKSQTPNVCINANDKVYIIPCTLEHALLGDLGNLITLAVIKNENHKISVKVPIKPNVLTNINVGDNNQNIAMILKKTIQECYSTNLSTTIPITINESELDSSVANMNFDEKKIKFFHAHNYDSFDTQFITDDSTLTFSFGTKDISLPISKIINGSICVLATVPNNPIINWEIINKCKSGIISINPFLFCSTSRHVICSHLFNGLFVLNCNLNKQVYENLIDNQMNREKYMNTIPTNFMSMCGHESIICVKLQFKTNYNYYWYEGVRRKGIFDTTKNFGDNITNEIERWINWCENTDLNDLNWIKNENIYESILEQFKNYTLEIFKDTMNKVQIDDDLNKLDECIRKIRMFPEHIIDICKEELIKFIKSNCTQNMIEYNLNESFEKYDIKKMIEIRKLNKIIINKIGTLFSNRSSSSRGFSLKTLERRETIKNNVEKTTNMTIKDYCDYLDNFNGCLVVNIPRSFLESIGSNHNTKEITLSFPSCLIFDEVTSSAMVECASEINRYDMLDHCRHISIPQSTHNSSEASILIPINKYAKRESIEDIIWTSETNEPDFSIFRIKLRGCISGVRNSGFSSSSPELTKFLINFYLSIIENLNPSKTLDFNDTVPTVIRGILCHIMATFASGQKPFSQLYTLFYPDQILTLNVDEFGWLYRIIKILEFTGYNYENVIKNTKMILVNYIFKQINPCLTNAQKSIKKYRRYY